MAGVDSERGDQSFYTSTLTIKNFSCWNSEIHGTFVSAESDFLFALYPKGRDGESENLVVHVYDERRKDGEIFIVTSDGSILSKVEITDSDRIGAFSFITTELKFKEVVSYIVKDPSHKDILSLQYRSRTDGFLDRYFKLEIIEKFIEIPTEIFENFPMTENCSCDWVFLFDDRPFSLDFVATSTETDGIEMVFELNTSCSTKNIFLQCCIYCCKKSGELLESHLFKHTFTKNESWNFNFSLPPVKGEELNLLIRLKILTTGSQNSHSTFYKSVPKGLTISNSGFKAITEIRETSVSSNKPKDYTLVLSKELGSLYHQDQAFSDYELRCGTVSFPTHRGILSARSPVLKAMLSGNMRESTSGSMDVEDLDPHTLGRFLSFLYSGTSEDLEWESALKLYYAADKYQVPSLKDLCSTVLRDSVSLDNVCDILSLADKHQDEELRSFSRNFILENYNEVLGSEEWRSFMKQDPLLLCETLTYFGEKKCLLVKK